MVKIELSNEEAQKVLNWLNDSFNHLEIGGLHRNAAVRLRDELMKKI